MVTAVNLGFPRIGANRELKKALEAFWSGKSNEGELQSVAKQLRARHWELQKEQGIELIPSNDFSMYDQVLDMIATVGAVPERYNWDGSEVNAELYFSMARGCQNETTDVVAMEMTKWFDTNYHYIVPEFTKKTKFTYSFPKAVNQYVEAKELGIETRPVLVGPVTFLSLGKFYGEGDQFDLLDELLAVYLQVIEGLEEAGAQWIQIDEPCLVTDLNDTQRAAYKAAFAKLTSNRKAKILVATYFGELGDNAELATSLNADALHVDLVRAPAQLDDVLAKLSDDSILSVGVVDGRNIWKNNYATSLELVNKAVDAIGSERVFVAPSCSLLHSPVDLDGEEALNAELKNWLAFAKQKLNEVSVISRVSNQGAEAFAAELEANAKAQELRTTSTLIHNQDVKQRVAALTEADSQRDSAFDKRVTAQHDSLDLPALPTTTIGSFPQTQEIRAIRRQFKRDEVTREQYDEFIAKLTKELIEWQDEIDIDMPVHGEYERNDMVEYFGEKLEGYAFTANGWVQSYGSRCVKPPVIFGDVSRPQPMTVKWTSYAQSLTTRPVKGMLTGPITMLQWAFVRDDQPRDVTCRQIALAIRDEVADLEKAGIKAIQIDEPAFREGLPLREANRQFYLDWAVDAFRITASVVDDATQIHTHMCYSEFNDIIQSIADLDADVISIETSRSAMELLDAFVEFKYPNEIGPGVYDIHSPRVPKVEEMQVLLNKALEVLDAKQVWVNPDCGLKTRKWDEVKPALENMVIATKNLRKSLKDSDVKKSA